MRLSLVKKGIAAAAATVEGLNTYAFVPDSVEVPCLYAGEADVRYDTTFGGDYDVVITCYVFTSVSDDESGQELLDELLADEGASSVKAAIEGTPGIAQTLGGVCDDVHIPNVTGYRMYQVGEKNYFGAKLPVRVIGVRN